VPGTPPGNPYKDNLLAMGPKGMYGIRSGEYIQPEPAVKHYGLPFMNAVRNMTFQPSYNHYYSGGSVDGSGGGGSWQQGPTELGPYERSLLREIAHNEPVVVVGDSAVAQSASRGGRSNTRRGGS
jgi:hypothetical protein